LLQKRGSGDKDSTPVRGVLYEPAALLGVSAEPKLSRLQFYFDSNRLSTTIFEKKKKKIRNIQSFHTPTFPKKTSFFTLFQRIFDFSITSSFETSLLLYYDLYLPFFGFYALLLDVTNRGILIRASTGYDYKENEGAKSRRGKAGP